MYGRHARSVCVCYPICDYDVETLIFDQLPKLHPSLFLDMKENLVYVACHIAWNDLDSDEIEDHAFSTTLSEKEAKQKAIKLF